MKPIFTSLHISLEENNKNNTEGGDAQNTVITVEHIRKAKAVLESQVLPCLAASRIPGSEGDASAASVLTGLPLGFSTGDQGVDIAATVLRMLYIKDMRELQDQIDSAIVKMQEITADPKTDGAMHKTGR